MLTAKLTAPPAAVWPMLAVLLTTLAGQAHSDPAATPAESEPDATEHFATGFVRDKPAEYHATAEVPQFRAFYPPRADLAADLPTPGHQGQQASCVAWAVGYAARTFYLKHNEAADISQAENILSPAYIYNSLRETRGDCSTGTSILDALKLLKSSGGVPLDQLPYDPKECLDVPSPAVLARYSDRFRIKGYRRVEGKNEDDIKGQIYSGNPVMFGLDVPAGFEHYRGGVIDTVEDSGPDNGHAMVIIGYDDSKQAYHFVNSWGTHWGENGFGWISYRSAAALWVQGYVMEVESAASVPPTPSPPVVPPAPPPATHAAAPPQIDLSSPCSSLSAAPMRNERGFSFRFSGFVASADELERLRRAALARPGVTGIDATQVSVRPWPQCEALLTLDAALSNRHGIRITQTPDKSPLVRGDHMIFDVESPDYPSYFYVAYLQADGTAAHLLRPTGSEMVSANTVFHLGDSPGTPRFRVGPPFGHEMVIALASDHPFQDEGLIGAIRERQLLTAYRRVLRDMSSRIVSASVLYVETAEQ